MIKRSHTQVFYGRRGSGKSELCRALWVGMRPWRICIDVKDDRGEYLPGVPVVQSPKEILDHDTVRIVPARPNDVDWYNEIYELAFVEGDCLVWCDELNEVTKPNFVPESMRRYILQGRTRECGHLGCTPRPADIHPVFGAQADQIYIFRVTHPRDQDAVAGLIGMKPAELERTIAELPRYHYIHCDDDGELSVNEPSHDPDELTAKIARLNFGSTRASQTLL